MSDASNAAERGAALSLVDAAHRCAALRARLQPGEGGRALACEERAILRGEIAALIRASDAQVTAWRAVADAARALPELWKQLPPVEPSAAADLAEATADVSTRSDHLGASTFTARGWTAYAAGDFAAAERAYERALTLAPDDLDAIAMLAWARVALGRDDDALVAAQRVLVASSRSAAASLARVAVGRVCLAKGIAGEAIEHLARVVRDNDDRRATLYATFYLGVAHQQRAMYDDAVAYFDRALALGPNLVEARYELGCAHWRAGARDAARAAWRAGAALTFSAWAPRCAERLAELERAESTGA